MGKSNEVDWTYWECGCCGQAWFRCGCAEPQPVAVREMAPRGRCDRHVAGAIARANETGDVRALLADEDVWNWLAHSPGEAELAYGPMLYQPPRHSIFLSGVECEFTRTYAGRHDLGILIQPGTSSYRHKLGAYARWGADNGCFSQGAAFDVEAWKRWVTTLPTEGCLFVVAPDVYDPVAGRGDPVGTWERSAPVLPHIRSCGLPAALVAQDGIEDMDLDWTAFDCLFLGGSTEWKLSSAAADVAREARAQGLWTHMGRVNSKKRIRFANVHGLDSVDGTFLAYGPRVNGPKLLSWLETLDADDRQTSLLELLEAA